MSHYIDRSSIDHMKINSSDVDDELADYDEYPRGGQGQQQYDPMAVDGNAQEQMTHVKEPLTQAEEQQQQQSSMQAQQPAKTKKVQVPKTRKTRAKRSSGTSRTYTDDEIEKVLDAYFNDPSITSMEEAGATVGMPKASARKLVNTYKHLFPKVEKKRKTRTETGITILRALEAMK
ncbi:hypothetical protein BJV82DRAFT_661217 [Fennellomyces sp. T-0311]|nr:hypothetical protein BJV82DRAFT_661217 [Fennellomyces sp. T-0311]